MPRLRNGKRRLHYVALPASSNKRAKRSGATTGSSAGGGAAGAAAAAAGGGGGGGVVMGGMVGGGRGCAGMPPSALPPCRGGKKGKGKGKAMGGVKNTRCGATAALGMMTGAAAAAAVPGAMATAFYRYLALSQLPPSPPSLPPFLLLCTHILIHLI